MGQDRSQAKSFVIETPVSCYNPRKLLRSSDLKPASIDVLIVDAEGMDAEIVLAFLSIPTFRPRAIVAEVKVAVSGFSKRLNTTLLDAGYITEMGDSRNLFAWKSDVSRIYRARVLLLVHSPHAQSSRASSAFFELRQGDTESKIYYGLTPFAQVAWKQNNSAVQKL